VILLNITKKFKDIIKIISLILLEEMDYKIAVCGSGGVGKSCITIQFVQNLFIDDYDPTIEDMYRKQIFVDGETCLLDVLDTAGQDEYVSMRDPYMRSSDGFILVFSLTSQLTLDETNNFYNQILRCKDKNKVPIILAGNKCDLHDQRKVSNTVANATAQKYNAIFIECSAKKGYNITELFENAVREIRKDRCNVPIQKPKKKCIVL